LGSLALKHRTEIARRTARALGYNYRYVNSVTREFLQQSNDFLCENRVLVLEDFGRFIVVPTKTQWTAKLRNNTGDGTVTREVEVPWVMKVHFSKSQTLKKLLDEHYLENLMDKLGVDTSTGRDDEQLEKEAAEGCPECGSELTKHGSVLLCPVHGSAPFETKKGV
jgi:nucleoid DNA-binding protein